MKIRKILFMAFTLVCFLGILTSFIVDMAINREITWAMYPILSAAFAWAFISPLAVKKYGLVLSSGVFTILVLPYLYFLSRITPVSGWFIPLGLPLGVIGIVALWIHIPLYRIKKLSIWNKLAVTIFLLGTVGSGFVNYFIDIYLGDDPFRWSRYFNVIICTVCAAAIAVYGFMLSKSKKAE